MVPRFQRRNGSRALTLPSTIEWIEDARTGVRVARVGSGIVVEWPHLGRYFALGEARPEQFVAEPSAAAHLIEKFRATELLACRRYLAGRLSLHGAAVAVGPGAVAIVGDSGAGKSTTAMALVERGGAQFLADDIVPVDWDGVHPIVSPVDDAFWLGADSLAWFGLSTEDSGGKRACPPRARASSSIRLTCIVELSFDDGAPPSPQIEQLTGALSFRALARCHVCFRSGEPSEDIGNLEVRSSLCRAVPLYRVRRRRGLQALPSVLSVVAELAAQRTSTTS